MSIKNYAYLLKKKIDPEVKIKFNNDKKIDGVMRKKLNLSLFTAPPRRAERMRRAPTCSIAPPPASARVGTPAAPPRVRGAGLPARINEGFSRATLDRVDKITATAADHTASRDVRLVAARGLARVCSGEAVNTVLTAVNRALAEHGQSSAGSS